MCPTTWYALGKFVREHSPFGICDVECYDVCPNDCLLFRAQYRNDKFCRHCSEPRFDETGKARRTFHVFPLVPRVRRWLESPIWSQHMEYASTYESTPGVISDIMDGRFFTSLIGTGNGKLKNTKYNVTFSLGVDANIARASDDYSVVPIMATCVSFSPHFRYSADFSLVLGIIPGPGKNNEEIFLRVILDEFETSFKDGFSAYDCLSKEWHVLHLMVLFILVDTKGLGDLTCGWTAPARVMCHKCELIGVSLKNSNLLGPQGSTVYPGSWSNLPQTDPIRRLAFLTQLGDLGDDEIRIKEDAPPIKNRTEESLADAAELSEASGLPVKNPLHPSRTHFMKRRCFLSHHSPLGPTKVMVDECHQHMNAGKQCVELSLGIGTGRVTDKRIAIEVTRGRHSSDDLSDRILPWMMSKEEVVAVNRLVSSLAIPGWKGGRLPPPLNTISIGRFKMHQWKVLCGEVIIYVLLKTKSFSSNPSYREFWVRYWTWWNKMHADVHTEETVKDLELEGYRLHALREIMFPLTALKSTTHFETHMVDVSFFCFLLQTYTNQYLLHIQADAILDKGALRFGNQFSNERNAAAFSKGTSSAHDLETSMSLRYIYI